MTSLPKEYILHMLWMRSLWPRRVVLAAIVPRSISSLSSMKVIDSHLHIWATPQQARNGFPYHQDPPANLASLASTEELLQQMQDNNVDGALIVQPINHQFDHSYVAQALCEHPSKFKGMLLHDPNMPEAQAIQILKKLKSQGFVGVRYNPYLWPKKGDNSWQQMSQGTGLQVYRECGKLQLPVGVMCFQGLGLHFDDIVTLLNESPDTVLILDHFGFAGVDDASAFEQLLSLAKYPQVYVKISAVFRLHDTSPFERVRAKRFLPLLEAFGARRLLYGSDFPFVLEQTQAYAMSSLVASWIDDEDDRKAIMGGTAESLFGSWS